jgi:hypothetical protein
MLVLSSDSFGAPQSQVLQAYVNACQAGVAAAAAFAMRTWYLPSCAPTLQLIVDIPAAAAWHCSGYGTLSPIPATIGGHTRESVMPGADPVAANFATKSHMPPHGMERSSAAGFQDRLDAAAAKRPGNSVAIYQVCALD